MSFDWRALLGKVAPWIATALGGPAAGMATKAIASALGLGEEASEGQIAEAMAKATPEQIAAIKQADADFQIKMKEMDIKSVYDLEKLNADDRANARNREIQVKDRTPSIGFYLLTTGFYGLLAFFCYASMKPEIKPNSEIMDILKIMVGSLGTAWVGAVQYYYGTTAGSRGKDEMLYNSTPGKSGK
jgi:membrane-bound ClpP family serine protease